MNSLAFMKRNLKIFSLIIIFFFNFIILLNSVNFLLKNGGRLL